MSLNFIKGFIERGGAWVFGSSLLVKILAFILSIVVVRLVSIEEFAIISIYKNFFLIALPLLGLGLNHSLLYYGSKHRTKAKKSLLLLKCLITAIFVLPIVFLLLYLVARFIPNFYFSTTIFTYAFFSYFSLFCFGCFLNYYRISEDNKLFSKINSFYSLFSLFVILSFVSFKADAEGYFIAQFLSSSIFSVSLLCFFWSDCKGLIKISYFKRFGFADSNHIKYGFVVALGSLASQLMLVADTFMLSILGEELSDIGIFSAASFVFISLLFIPSVYMTTDFVHIAKCNEKEVRIYYKSYFFVMFPVVTIMVLPLLLIPEFILYTIFGENYINGSDCLKYFSIALLFSFLIRTPIGNILSARGYANINVGIAIFFSIVNMGLNFILIPKYGIEGASIATTITISISSIVSLFFLKKKLG
ncbi:polysaccharide biosynthesis C-terminal domain-containing protein [Motilimonas eburnea]|uniref:oligosaccharide flippase family protein n=1 Tax=Motilimonas eburnea TaxID=1737488 RepID=UPI001E389A1F|nr:polysaccharide biosynthesis C-terminal domain-containing protein [Motilimonas eburnea]MCE2572592.1 polysaccharide biosynthesis C-terminal domain-containing protein [Motilimonas eburnea]